jgi:S1-C subfamily serine protease
VTAVARRRLAAVRGRLLIGVGAGVAILIALAVVLLPVSRHGASTGRSPVTALRVASGAEIATGFAVGRDRVVTVAHALGAEGAARPRAVSVDRVRGRVLRLDRRSDLALLAVPDVASGSWGAAADAPAIASASAGDALRVVRLRDGRSSSVSVHVRRTLVAHVRTLGAERAVTRPALELAGRVAPGDSGAPVISGSGALVGVVFATSSRRERTAYAVDASAVRRLLAGELRH